MNKFLLLLAFLPVIIVTSSCSSLFNDTQAQENQQEISNLAIAQEEPFNYSDYGAVLETYVNENGLVNYGQLQANRQQLDRFNQSLAAVSPSTYESWTNKEKIAFWMNAYNAFTLQSIIDQEPLKKSIKDIPGVWRIRKFEVAGQSLTLNNIEHDILRKDFDEPRLHVALVCAAMSCPPLRNEPYIAAKLDEQLDDQVKQFIASPHGFRSDRNQGRVYLSSIFKWYGEDWVNSYAIKDKFAGNAKERAVLNFLSNYLSAQQRQYLEQGQYKVSYLDYDWTLNQQ